MTTADVLTERALSLARSGADTDEAVRELLVLCAGRRVAAVRARQNVMAWLDSAPDQHAAMQAMGFFDELLNRLPV